MIMSPSSMIFSSGRPMIRAERSPEPNTVKITASAPSRRATPSAMPAAYRSVLPIRSAPIIARNPASAMRAASLRQAISFSDLRLRKSNSTSAQSAISQRNAASMLFRSTAGMSLSPATPSFPSGPFWRSSAASARKLV